MFSGLGRPPCTCLTTFMGTVCRGYWRDVRNVRQELEHWLKTHPLGAPQLLPSQSQLRRTGSSSLAFAVTQHGGYAKLLAE